MAQKVTDIDSGATQTTYAWEQTRGVAADPRSTWQVLDLNSYSDGSAKYENTTRSVLNGTRRAQKGAQTSKTATFGYAIDNTIDNLLPQFCSFLYNTPNEQATTRSIIHGAPVTGLPTGDLPTAVTATSITIGAANLSTFAVNDIIQLADGTNNNRAQIITAIDTSTGALTVKPVSGGGALVPTLPLPVNTAVRRVGVAPADAVSLKLSADGATATISTDTDNFTHLDITVGQWLFVGRDGISFDTQSFFGRVVAAAPKVITLDTTTSVLGTTDEGMVAREIYFGTFIADGNKQLTVTHSRYLGVNGDGKHMRETTVGCMPNEFTINAKERSLQTVDLTFMGMDATYADLEPSDNAKYMANVIPAPSTDPLNMSTDVVRQRLSVPKVGAMNTAAIHSFIKESTIAIKNNLQENTANGFVGNVGASAGEFSATGTVKTYFNSLAAFNAVRCNCTVAMDWIFARKHQGIVYDMPSVQLGAESISIEKNQSIQIDLTQSSFESSKFGFQFGVTIFHYLPSIASPTESCDC